MLLTKFISICQIQGVDLEIEEIALPFVCEICTEPEI